MWLRQITRFLSMIADPAAKGLNTIGCMILAAMMFLTGADVTSRYIFNHPIPDALSITEFMLLAVISLSLAYCAVKEGHITIDLVIKRLPERGQAIVLTISSLVSLAIFGMITWGFVALAEGVMNPNKTSPILYIPVFPFIFIAALGGASLFLVTLRDFFENLSKVFNK